MFTNVRINWSWKLTRSKDDDDVVVNDDDEVVDHHHLEVDKEEMEDFQCRALPRNLLDVIGTHLIMIVNTDHKHWFFDNIIHPINMLTAFSIVMTCVRVRPSWLSFSPHFWKNLWKPEPRWPGKSMITSKEFS